MTDRPTYEVVVVGGGPAGMTTGLYATRLGHRTAVFEKGGGRHAAVEHVHNLYGVSEDVSGRELADHAVHQLEAYGADYYLDPIQTVSRADGSTPAADADATDADGTDVDDASRFVVEGEYSTVYADRVVFATGFSDVEPSVPGIQRFSGRGLYYCLHCDAYQLGDASAYVLGHADHAASVAMLLLNFTGDVDLLLDGQPPEWSDETERQLRAHPVDRVDTEVVRAYAHDEDATESHLGGLAFADGTERDYRGGFAMYGTEYDVELAERLGCERTADGALAVDDNQETSVGGAYAVGDVTHGQNQTAIAIADGATAGIALHKDLRTYPRPLDELDGTDESDAEDSPREDADGEFDVPAAAADVRARMRLLRERDSFPGLDGSTNDR